MAKCQARDSDLGAIISPIRCTECQRVRARSRASALSSVVLSGCRSVVTLPPKSTLAHELAHTVTHDACVGMPRDVREVVAESVAYAVCSRFGLDLSLRSVDYVAGWGHPQGHDPEAFRVGMAAIHDGATSLIDAIEAAMTGADEPDLAA